MLDSLVRSVRVRYLDGARKRLRHYQCRVKTRRAMRSREREHLELFEGTLLNELFELNACIHHGVTTSIRKQRRTI